MICLLYCLALFAEEVATAVKLMFDTVVSLNPPMGIDRQHQSWDARSLYPSAL
jgi:hypothetical protein